jgi:transcriptional regulator with XRE-family HTH domain
MRDTVRLINGSLVRRRRLELGISERSLASLAGFGLATLSDIEDHDGQDRTVTLGALTRLAGALDLTPAQLVDVPVESNVEPAEPDDEDDVRLVAQVFIESRVVLYVDDVAQVFGWTYARASTAIDALNARLDGTGLHVHRFPGRAHLRPKDATHELTGAMGKILAARRGIDRRQAGLVYSAMQGLNKSGRTAVHGDNRGRPTLVLLGLLKEEGGRRFSLGDDLRYALDL